ncbi:hypothetical protein COU36_04985 [Candidatus Micrarchaeota archaeon CG10_big_fil_rev_8_21_14_0_10_59_7]|nr:MAG: hypothetical protein COU36_04985 [Candidatus Micrarchaeota archaeon CG10_big_fil_rev_8_21_14_0_10_59_7]
MNGKNGLKEVAARVKTDGVAPAAPKTDMTKQPYMFVPLEANRTMGDGAPIHSLDVTTRADVIKAWIADDTPREGTLGAVYTYFFYSWVALAATLLTYGINLYVAAVFAYITGFCWSQVLLSYAWSAEWFKGKALVHTV